jgi:tryptophan synthase alpha chain
LKKLVAYITTSMPDNSFTVDLALSLKESGVDILELGIPFSDPVADGPVIEKANLLALQQGFKIKDLFEVSMQIAPHIDTLWMGYINPFFHIGFEEFCKKAQKSGVQGFIIPDLPFEEAALYRDLLKSYNQTLINFVAPTSNRDRIKLLTQYSSKFIYLVAYTGITGSGKSEDLSQTIQTIKEFSKDPIYLGFGVDETNAKEKVKDVDGVIVGSTLVKHLLDDSLSNQEKIAKISSIAKKIKEDINS